MGERVTIGGESSYFKRLTLNYNYNFMPDRFKKNENVLKEASSGYIPDGQGADDRDIDLSLLEESLRLTPWERMLANDDALNFAESLIGNVGAESASKGTLLLKNEERASTEGTKPLQKKG